MKSSTLRRSTLSKETISVIEHLASNEDSVGEYLRPDEVQIPVNSVNNTENKSKEIDLLWQNFKVTQFNTKSPFAYISMGFVCGVIVTILIGCFTMKYIEPKAQKPVINIDKIKIFEKAQQVEDRNQLQRASVNIPGEKDTADTTLAKSKTLKTSTSDGSKYVVKDGDTGVKILKVHYGEYSPEKEELVKKANNLSSLDKLSIGQELILPEE